jgi:hypothetical protein
VSAEERKKQLAQLVEMGVAIPEQFRPEMALSGEWQTVSETIIQPGMKEEEDVKPDQKIIGVRKRKYLAADIAEDDEEGAGTATVRKQWGSTIKSYPGPEQHGEDRLEALLISSTYSSTGHGNETQFQGEQQPRAVRSAASTSVAKGPAHCTGSSDLAPAIKKESSEADRPAIKEEPPEGDRPAIERKPSAGDCPPVGQDPSGGGGRVPTDFGLTETRVKLEEGSDEAVIFKKRKAKPVRQR